MNTPRRIRNTTPLSFVLLLALGLGGCALHPVPSMQLDQARAAITTASAAGADDEGVEELERAREKFALTKRWLDAKDNEPARWLAEQAQVDAELATVKVAAAGAERAAILARAGQPALIRTTFAN